MVGSIDFGILRTPDYSNALRYYEAGQDRRKEEDRRNALRMGDISALEGMGDFQAAAQLRQTQQLSRRKELSGLYATDQKAAVQGAQEEGDFDLLSHFKSLREDQQAEEMKKLEAGVRVMAPMLTMDEAQWIPYLTGQGVDAEDAAEIAKGGKAGIKAEIDKIRPLQDIFASTQPNWKSVKDDERLVDTNDPDNLVGQGQPAQQAAPMQAGGQQQAGGMDDVFGALIQQESGGRAGVLGPQTDYGRAEGMTQMLPATAQSMAQKLGVPWRPELMRGDTPEAAQYQKTLGRAYFDEGLEKYGGDVNKALMYYHGGPDERLWGPKTRRYAAEVQGRLQGGQGDAQPYQVASTGPTPPPPQGQAPQAQPQQQFGGRVIQGPPKREAAPSGYRWAPDGRSLERIPGGPAIVDADTTPPPAASGLTSLGGNFYRDRIGRVYQSDRTGKMVQTVGVTDGAVQKATETMVSANTLMQAVDEFEQAVIQVRPRDFGPQGKYAGDPERYARMKAAATNLQMMLKGPAAYNLGVITGPDLEILQGVVADPALLDTAVRRGQIRPSLRQLATNIGYKVKAEREGFKAVGGDPRGLPKFYADERREQRQRQSTATNAPKVGEVRQGYSFKGGDPASPSSWVKVK